jgi:tetratricopeptide (TPR) repeat protein
MGNLEDAKQKCEKALEIRQKLLKTDPENVSYQSDVSMTLNNLSLMLWTMGRLEESKQRSEEALEMKEKLLQKDPENVSYQSGVSSTLSNLGLLLKNMGRLEESKQKYEKALEMKEKLLQTDPENKSYQSDVSMTLNNLGLLLKNMGHLEESKQRYEKALEMKEKLLQTDPENVSYQTYVSSTLNNLGLLLSDMGLLEESKQRYEKALEMREKLLQTYPQNFEYQSDFAETLNGFGTLLKNEGEMEEAIKKHEQALKIQDKLLESDLKNVVYLSNVGETLNDLGNSLFKMNQFKEAKEKYERALKIRDELLKTDSGNLIYRSKVGETLNNLGTLLFDLKEINEAKQRYEQALEICSDSTQFLIVGKKAQSIIGVIRSLLELAEIETNSHKKMPFLIEGINVCKQNKNFFKIHDLKHEGNLALEAGLRAYLDYLMRNIGGEHDPDKRVKEYEKSIIAIKKIEAIEQEDKNKVLLASALSYLRGRKLINESLISESPDMELIKEAREQFKIAKETYAKATVCYCIYTGILEVESIEDLDKESGLKIKSIRKVIEELKKEISTPANSRLIATFEEIILLLENKESRGEEEIRSKLNDNIMKVDSFAVRNILDHTGKKISQKLAEYQKEPFSPISIEYCKWKLIIKFTDPEKVKGILTIEVGGEKIFDEPLHGKKEITVPYIPIRRKGEIVFKIAGQETKSVTRPIEFYEYLDDLKVCILKHDCKKNILINSKLLNIAVVQLKYEITKEGRVIKLTVDKSLEKKLSESVNEKEIKKYKKEKVAYWKKVRSILEAVKEKAKIIVFPEFSIPFELLTEMQRYADENKIIVVAGSHYITEENLDRYKDLFLSEVQSKDLRKNICPIVIPSSKIVHTEKLLPAAVERKFLSSEGMNYGELKHIFKISDKLNLGILICFEYLDKLRIRFIDTCDILLVPQTNPNTDRFYQVALEDLNNPQSPGNKAYIMANGIFPLDGKMSGGSSGVLLTLDKNSHKEQVRKAIRGPIDGIYEQFVLLTSINTEFNPARDISQGQVAISSTWIPIIEEYEILERAKDLAEKRISPLVALFDENLEKQKTLKSIIENEKKKIDEETQRFIDILLETKKCEGEVLKSLLKNNASIIERYSPLMYEENAKDLENLTPEEIKEKCCPIFISTNI